MFGVQTDSAGFHWCVFTLCVFQRDSSVLPPDSSDAIMAECVCQCLNNVTVLTTAETTVMNSTAVSNCYFSWLIYL